MVETRKSKLMGATPGVEVYVTLPSGRTVILSLQPSDNIKTVCERIAAEEGVPADRVNIKYTGKVLNKSHTLGYLGVCPDTVLKAEIIQIKKLNVFVKLPEGETVSMQIDNVSPVRYISEHLESVGKVPVNKQLLKVGGRNVGSAEQRVMDAGITDECALSLEVVEPKPVSKSSGGANNTPDEMNMKEDDKEAVMGSFDAAGKNVEVVFCFDTTGSMYSCLDQVRAKLKETTRRLIQEIPNIRIGIMAHGDYCDYTNYVVRYIDLTNDVDALIKFTNDVPKTGGGDSPECYEWALHKAQQLDWSEDSAKAFVMIGDCSPHYMGYTDQNINWHQELDVLAGMGIKVYGVKALGQHHKEFYEELADRTGGAYITFQNFAIITEMFLAVCYREASAEQFEAYCQEVTSEQEGSQEQGGSQAERSKQADVKNMIKQLADQSENRERVNRYVAESWWDPQLDTTTTPLYCYDSSADTWSPYNKTRATVHVNVSPASLSTDTTSTAPARTTGSTKKHRFSLRRKSSPASGGKDSKKTCAVM